MHVIEHTYISLLADVANLSGLREIRGSYESLHWCLNEAPKLEKHILGCIESGQKPDLDMFPDGLKRLAAASVKDAVQLRYLRQLLLFCYKASVTHDKSTTDKAFSSFLETNFSVGRFGADLARVSPRLLDRVRKHVQSVLNSSAFGRRNEEPVFKPWAIKPGHGPGAVTTSKERWEQLYSSIDAVYPYSSYLDLYGCRGWDPAWYESMASDSHIEAKVIAVPKDTRGPRLICVHPAEAIWIQQGLRRELERSICTRRTSRGPWPYGHIFFDDQSVNGKIALLSSKSRRYATIDMKEASDRISEPLVQILFGRNYKYFGCCRAQKFVIPELGSARNLRGDIHSYAPMGNATTFPVQSLVFWAICVASMQSQGFHQPGAAFVFGDDIIIPTECVESVVDDLEAFGLLVNRTKSFWRGAFRESCGVDAFNGVNVTPVRWKTTIDAENIEDLQALSDIAMRLRIAGYEEAAVTTYQTLRIRLAHCNGSFLTRKFRPKGRLKRFIGKRRLSLTNNRNHGSLAEYVGDSAAGWTDAVWHPHYQWYHSPVWQLDTRTDSRAGDDWNHVLESVCSLERTGRSSIPDRSLSRATRLVRGWIPVA